jgi:Na+/melibiose symporter-like transporter
MLILAVAFFFILAACLAIIFAVLKTRDTTELMRAELAEIRKELARLTTRPN